MPRAFRHHQQVQRLHPSHGGFNLFNWAVHTAVPWVWKHWRGIAQIGIIGGGILCVASGLCAWIAGTALGLTEGAALVGGSILSGSAVGAADYATSGGSHSAEGYAAATFEGGAGGLIGGGWSLAVKMAGGGLGTAYAGALLLRGGTGLVTYDANTPSHDRTLRRGVNAFVLGSSRGLSVPVKAFLASLGGGQ